MRFLYKREQMDRGTKRVVETVNNALQQQLGALGDEGAAAGTPANTCREELDRAKHAHLSLFKWAANYSSFLTFSDAIARVALRETGLNSPSTTKQVDTIVQNLSRCVARERAYDKIMWMVKDAKTCLHALYRTPHVARALMISDAIGEDLDMLMREDYMKANHVDLDELIFPTGAPVYDSLVSAIAAACHETNADLLILMNETNDQNKKQVPRDVADTIPSVPEIHTDVDTTHVRLISQASTGLFPNKAYPLLRNFL